jgi:hypothetical protein
LEVVEDELKGREVVEGFLEGGENVEEAVFEEGGLCDAGGPCLRRDDNTCLRRDDVWREGGAFEEGAGGFEEEADERLGGEVEEVGFEVGSGVEEGLRETCEEGRRIRRSRHKRKFLRVR